MNGLELTAYGITFLITLTFVAKPIFQVAHGRHKKIKIKKLFKFDPKEPSYDAEISAAQISCIFVIVTGLINSFFFPHSELFSLIIFIVPIFVFAYFRNYFQSNFKEKFPFPVRYNQGKAVFAYLGFNDNKNTYKDLEKDLRELIDDFSDWSGSYWAEFLITMK